MPLAIKIPPIFKVVSQGISKSAMNNKTSERDAPNLFHSSNDKLLVKDFLYELKIRVDQ